MPVPDLPLFNPCYDIHLLRGQSIRIDTLLEINGREVMEYLKEPEHATLRSNFSPLSNKLEMTLSETGPTTFEGLGIIIHIDDTERWTQCTVEALAAEPADV